MSETAPQEVLNLLKDRLEGAPIQLAFSVRQLSTPGEVWVIDVWEKGDPEKAAHAVIHQFDSVTTLAGATIESPSIDSRSRVNWLYATILNQLSG